MPTRAVLGRGVTPVVSRSSAPAAAETTTVGIGESGADVSAVQQWLLAAYPAAAAAGLRVTGTYDEPTAAIIRQWKAEHPGYGGPTDQNVFVIPRSAITVYLPAPGAPAAAGSANADAQAQIKTYLDQWGLSSLTAWAWEQVTAGRGANEILMSLREQQAYKERFAGNLQRSDAGYAVLSENQYIAYETQLRQMMRAADMPAGFYDSPSDFADLIGKDVSVSEVASRIQLAADLSSSDPTVNADTRAELTRLYGAGGLAAYYLDPNRALPVLQRQAAAARTAAVSQRTGFGQLNARQAERVSELSSSVEQTAQAFSQLRRQRELMQALPGELGVDTITADEQINAALGGDAQQAERISRRARKRQADFQASQGTYAPNSLGRSTTSAL
jgi:hypothetical protein